MTARLKAAAGLAAVALIATLLVYRVLFKAQEVEMAEAIVGTIPLIIHGPGTVQPRFPVAVSPRITAVVTGLFADQGDRVRRGQVLAQLDDRDLAARAAAAGTELALAKANHQRDHEVFTKGYISQATMDAATGALRAAEARERETAAAVSYTRLAAPVDGVITARQVEVGQTVGPGTTIFRLADPRTLWIATRVDETVVGQVRVGQAAIIALRTGERLSGKVARVGLESDPATRELEVSVSFDAPPKRFAINQEAEVTIDVGEEHGVTIPASGLLQQGRGFGVLLVADGRAEFRPVTIGATDGERVVVREGLKAGEQVVRLPGGIKVGRRLRPVSGGAK
jgi:RND family efflux transporter MFP subunit